MATIRSGGPFFASSGGAVLADCAVLFVDILGVRDMANGIDAPRSLSRFSALYAVTSETSYCPRSGLSRAAATRLGTKPPRDLSSAMLGEAGE